MQNSVNKREFEKKLERKNTIRMFKNMYEYIF